MSTLQSVSATTSSRLETAFEALTRNLDDRQAQEDFTKAAKAEHDEQVASGLSADDAFGGSYPGASDGRYDRKFMLQAIAFGCIAYGPEVIDWSRVKHDLVHANDGGLDWVGEAQCDTVQIGAVVVEEWRKLQVDQGVIFRPDRKDFGFALNLARAGTKVKARNREIEFDALGFPVFPSRADVLLPRDKIFASRIEHKEFCISQLADHLTRFPDAAPSMGLGKTEVDLIMTGSLPPWLVWHHHQDAGRMQLVERKYHHARGVTHTGGMALWGQDDYRYHKKERIFMLRRRSLRVRRGRRRDK
jgi:hypothetical protein